MDAAADEAAVSLEAAAAAHPAIAAVELLPRKGVRRDYPAQNLFDVARGFSRRVPMARLLEIEPDIRPYLASLVVRAVHRAGDALTVPMNLRVDRLTEEEFDSY